MITYKFYKREDVKRVKKHGGELIASFGLTTDFKSAKAYIQKYELEQDYIYTTE